MAVDFSKPITAYELIAIILAALAILLPLLKWLYNKFVKKIEVLFLPSGTITLFFNGFGAYLSLSGVYQVKNKAAVIKDISAEVMRTSDSAKLALDWYVFYPILRREVAGNYERSFESAHPFKIEEDALAPVSVEFTNAGGNIGEKSAKILKPVNEVAMRILAQSGIELMQADMQVKQSREGQTAKLELNDFFFWKPGEYELILTTQYNGDRSFSEVYTFSVTNEESNRLRANIDNLLVTSVANHFRLSLTFDFINKKITKKV